LTYPTRDPTEVAIRKNYWSQAIAEYKLKDYPKKNNPNMVTAMALQDYFQYMGEAFNDYLNLLSMENSSTY
jgi:hypothetical protein